MYIKFKIWIIETESNWSIEWSVESCDSTQVKMTTFLKNEGMFTFRKKCHFNWLESSDSIVNTQVKTTNWPLWGILQLLWITKNPSIYNILCLVAWMMGQTNRRPSVWCSKHYFFSWFLKKFFAKILSIYFLIFFIKLQK